MDVGTVEGALIMRDLASAVIGRVNDAMEKLEGRAGKTGSAVEKAAQQYDKVADRLKTVGGALSSVGLKLSLGVTAPLAGAALAASKFASDFEASMTKVVTLSGNTAEEMSAMRAELLKLAPAVGKTPQELADALLVITSTGLKGAKAMEVLTASARAGAVGLGETKDVARAITAAVTAYGEKNLSAAKAAEVLFKAVKDGGAEANEFAGTLGRVVGIASQVGVSFEEVSGFIATFSRLGVDAAEATTSLRGVLSTFLQPTKEAEQALASVGLTLQDVRDRIRKDGLAAALTFLQTTFKDNTDALAAIFGNVRAFSGVLGNAGAQATQYAQIIAHLKQQTDELGEGFDKTSKTTAFTFASIKAQVQAVAIAFGDELAPSLAKVMANMQPVLAVAEQAVKAFAALPAPVQQLSIGLLAVAVAAGPLAFFLGNFISGLGGALAVTKKIIGAEALGGLVLRLKEIGPLTKAFGFAGLTEGLSAFARAVPGVSTLSTALSGLAGHFKEIAGLTRAFGLTGLLVGLQGLVSAIPGVSTLTGWIVRLGAALAETGKFIAAFGVEGLIATLQEWGIAIANVATKIPLVTAALGFLATPVGMVVGALLALVAAVRLVTGSWDFLIRPVQAVLGVLSDLYTVIKDETVQALQDLVVVVQDRLGAAWTTVQAGARTAIDWFLNIGRAVLEAISPVTTFVVAVGKAVASIAGLFAFNAVVVVLGALGVAVGAVVVALQTFWTTSKAVASVVGTVLVAAFDLWWTTTKAIAGVLADALGPAVSWLWQNALQPLARLVGTVIVEAFRTWWTTTKTVLGVLTDLANNLSGAIASGLQKFLGFIEDTFPALSKLVGAVATITGRYSEWQKQLKETADHIRARNGDLKTHRDEIAKTAKSWDDYLQKQEAASSSAPKFDTSAMRTASTAWLALGQAATQAAGATAAAGNSTVSLTAQLAEAQKVLSGLTAAQRAQIDAGLKLGKNNDEIAAGFNALYPNVRLTASAVELYKEQIKTAGESTKKAAEDIKRLRDEFSGAEAIKSFGLALQAIGETTGGDFSKLSREQLQELSDQLKKITEQSARLGTTLPGSFAAAGTAIKTQLTDPLYGAGVALQMVIEKQRELAAADDLKIGQLFNEDTIAKAARSMQVMGRAIKGVGGDLRKLNTDKLREVLGDVEAGIIALRKAGKPIPSEWRAWVAEVSGYIARLDGPLQNIVKREQQLAMMNPFGAALKESGETVSRIDRVSNSLRTLAQGFVNLSQVSGDTMSEVTRAIGQVVVGFDNALQGFNDFKEKFKANGNQMKGLGLEMATSLASGLLGGFSGIVEASQFTSGVKSALVGGLNGAAAGASTAGIIALAAGFSKTGAATAGIWGAIAGFAVGAIVAVWRGAETRRVMHQVGKEWGGDISKGLAESIKKDSKALFGGSKDAAQIFHLADLISEKGGLTTKTWAHAVGELRDTFSQLQLGVFDVAQATGVLDDNFKTFVDFLGGNVNPALKEIIDLNDRAGTSSKAIREFTTANATQGLQGLSSFIDARGAVIKQLADAQAALSKAKGKDEIKAATDAVAILQAQLASLPLDPEAPEAFGSALLGVFNRLVKDGVPALDAVRQMAPTIQSLEMQLQQAGLSGGAAFDQIRSMAALATDQAAGPALTAIAGLGSALQGLNNSAVLTQGQFAGITSQVTTLVNAQLAQGKTVEQLYPFISGSLQTIWELQKQFNFQVDEGTQALIDQAVEAGVVGAKHQSINQQMLDAITDIRDVLVGVGQYFGVTLPQQARDGARGVQNALDGINPPDIRINVGYDVPELKIPGSERPENFARGGIVKPIYAATGTIVPFLPKGTDTVPAMLTPKEGVLNTDAMRTLGTKAFHALNAGADLGSIFGGGGQMDTASLTRIVAVMQSLEGATASTVEETQRLVASMQQIDTATAAMQQIETVIATMQRTAADVSIERLFPKQPIDKFIEGVDQAGHAVEGLLPHELIDKYRDGWTQIGSGIGDLVKPVDTVGDHLRQWLDAIGKVPAQIPVRTDDREVLLTTKKIKDIPEEKALEVIAKALGLREVRKDIDEIPAEKATSIIAKALGVREVTADIDRIPQEKALQVLARALGLSEITQEIGRIPPTKDVAVPVAAHGIPEVLVGLKTIPPVQDVDVTLPDAGVVESRAKAVVDTILDQLARLPAQITIAIGTTGPAVPNPPGGSVPTPGAGGITTRPIPVPKLPPTFPSPTPYPGVPVTSPIGRPPDPTPYPTKLGFKTGTPNFSFLDFGRGTDVTLHGREAVVPEGQKAAAADAWGGGPNVTVLPVVVRGNATATDVDALIDALVRAEPAIAGNANEVRTKLRDALGI